MNEVNDWREGKTVYSVEFVKDSEKYISELRRSMKDIEHGRGWVRRHDDQVTNVIAIRKSIRQLDEGIADIKSGRVALKDWLDPRQFLNAGGSFKK